MIREINKKLRKILLVLAAIFFVFNLIEKDGSKSSNGHRHQSESFDDIWF